MQETITTYEEFYVQMTQQYKNVEKGLYNYFIYNSNKVSMMRFNLDTLRHVASFR